MGYKSPSRRGFRRREAVVSAGRFAAWLVVGAVLASAGACKPARPTGEAAEPVPAAQSRKGTAAREWVVAQVAGRDVTFGELEDVLESLPVYVRMRYQAPERRRDFLEAYVHFLAFSLEAEAEGFGRDPVLAERLKAEAADRFLQEHADLKVKSTDIPDAAVHAWCQAHPHELKAPVRRRLLHLEAADRAEGERLAFRVRKLMEDVAGDPVDAFRDLARQYSRDDATRADGGDLGWLPRFPGEAPVPEAIEKAAEGMADLYGIAGPVESADGFHVLFLAGIRPAVDETCDQARPRVVAALIDQERERLRDALLGELRKRGGVQVFDEVVERVAAEVRAGQEAEERRRAAAAGGAP